MNSPTILMEPMLLSPCTSPLLWLSSPGHHFSCPPGQHSSLITLSTTHGRKELFHPCSEESTLLEDIQPVRKDALPANFAKLLAQLSQLSLSLSQDQMAREEPLNTTSIWQSASSADSARKLAQLTLLLRDQISSTQHFYMRNYSTIRRSSSKMETNGNHSLQESWKLRLKPDEGTLTIQII